MNKRKLSVFNFITLNGYYKGVDGDINWHRHGEEENEFSSESLEASNMLLFGRVTYEMMAGWWPTDAALLMYPVVAKRMNQSEKIVFSNTLRTADWNNTTIIKGNIMEQIAQLKQQPGKDMTILGSGSIVKQFAEHNLIDLYHIMVDPVAIGEGVPIFDRISHKLDLKLTDTRVFKSGTVLLTYVPMATE